MVLECPSLLFRQELQGEIRQGRFIAARGLAAFFCFRVGPPTVASFVKAPLLDYIKAELSSEAVHFESSLQVSNIRRWLDHPACSCP